jgi:cell division protein FtsB
MIIHILILFFILLFVYHFLGGDDLFGVVEGLETTTTTSAPTYQSYDISNNPLILAQQNAGNIEYLKSQFTKLEGLDKEVQDISGNVVSLTNQVKQMVQLQSSKSSQLDAAKQKLNATNTKSSSSSSSS